MIQAASWSAPTISVGTYVPNNTKPPINAGTDAQIKPAADSTRKGGLSVDAFAVSAGAQFIKSVAVGALSSGNTLTVNGNKKIASNLTVSSLLNSSNQKVCTNNAGKLILCPANGACSTTHYSCTQGTSMNNMDGATSWTWNCNGINGGINATCSENKVPITGACSVPQTHYSCTQGTSMNNVDGATSWTWSCHGTNGGGNVTCWEYKPTNPINGACGGAVNIGYNTTDVYGHLIELSPSSPNVCSSGTVSGFSSQFFDGGGGLYSPYNYYTWTCNGSNGGSLVSCHSKTCGVGDTCP